MSDGKRKIVPIKTPIESIGSCKNVRNCGNEMVYLGNGYCLRCWDKGLGGGIKIPAYKKRKSMTKKIDSGDKMFNMFKQYMALIAKDTFESHQNYKEPETIALALTLAHQLDHVVCVLKPEGYEEPPKVRKINT